MSEMKHGHPQDYATQCPVCNPPTCPENSEIETRSKDVSMKQPETGTTTEKLLIPTKSSSSEQDEGDATQWLGAEFDKSERTKPTLREAFLAGARLVLERVEGTMAGDYQSAGPEAKALNIARERIRKEILE